MLLIGPTAMDRLYAVRDRVFEADRTGPCQSSGAFISFAIPRSADTPRRDYLTMRLLGLLTSGSHLRVSADNIEKAFFDTGMRPS